jgi:hypothetical protein
MSWLGWVARVGARMRVQLGQRSAGVWLRREVECWIVRGEGVVGHVVGRWRGARRVRVQACVCPVEGGPAATQTNEREAECFKS